MKKTFLYMTILTTALLSSCKGDYDDWASPQGYDAEEAQNVTFTVNPTTDIDLANTKEDSIAVFTSTIDKPDAMAITAYTVSLQDTTETKQVVKIPANIDGKVSVAELQNCIVKLYGKNPIKQHMNMIVTAYLKQETQAFYSNSNEVKINATISVPKIEEAYYLAGDMTGWTASSVQAFTHSETNVYDDPVFTTSFTTTTNNQTWKIVTKSDVDAGDIPGTGAVGPTEANKNSLSGSLVNEGAVAGIITEAGKYNISINMETNTYTITKAPTELYMTGSNYGWGETWNALTPVNGIDGEYWGIFYLHEDEEFKFAPQNDWGNDFGSSATINDVAGAGLSDNNGNLKVAKAGWYLLDVVNSDQRIVNVYAPNVYLIGNTAGEWNVADSHKFTIPTTEDGEFVSPAFAASDEVRICVSIGKHEWWRTEFIVLNGKITYRGNGGDQERVKVKEGQKAYLNFTNGTGSFK